MKFQISKVFLIFFLIYFVIIANPAGAVNIFQQENIRQVREEFLSLVIEKDKSEYRGKKGVVCDDPDAMMIPDFGKEYKSFDICAPNITIPREETTYWCSVHKLPTFKEKVHGVGFEAVISEDSKGKVHHILVFSCDPEDGTIPTYSGVCDVPEQPQQLSRCRSVLAAWAFGAKTFYYPEEAGLAFQSPRKSQYIRMEIHYNNMERGDGITDSSGIRFFYTNHLRQYGVGVVEMGVVYTPDMAIPPNQETFVWPGVCPAQCTKAALAEEGINVFGSQLHTHLAGRKVWVSHYRKGERLENIDGNDHYSTWNEEIHPVFPTKKILPGDEIVTKCDFETKRRRNVTVGGLGIKDEMCVSYLHYYPETNLEVCKSSVSKTSLKRYFDLQNLLQRSSSPASNYKDIKWDISSIYRLKILYNLAPLRIHCLRSNGEQWGGNWGQISNIGLF